MDKKLIEYVASLSRLELTRDEEEMFMNQLTDILSYIEKLRKLNTEDVKPMAYPLNKSNVFREDKLCPSTSKEEILANAPAKIDAFFKVPKVIE
ncbi:MAG: Asp-tRNA(Asn)/Glu-tRNA(Gln) amidotransferase subunit GatC [wastewater metagenome]|nr:Asp-tRNA(Asn)/Glu-tRNA(Gln) amidotransferase subunit GatC [Candidatus Loosdrechtia aerotolerans]